jgi:glutamate 5-kinase
MADGAGSGNRGRARGGAAGDRGLVGAIALGARKLGLAKGGRGSLADAQASASVGQIALAGLWAELLAGHGITAAQILLTLEDLEDRRRYLNVTATLGRLLAAGAVPVINENDSVATQEIRFGDNDRLAARVGQAAAAQGVLLLSDIDGLYDRDPRQAGAVRIPVVQGVTAEIHAMATGGSSSGLGSGGMTSKLQAAEIAEMAGMALAIIDGQPGSPIATAFNATRGTLFLPRRRHTARKAWLGGRLRMRGTVSVDAGAAAALARGSSLLAAGVTAIAGDFARGDAVAVIGPDGQTLARGWPNTTRPRRRVCWAIRLRRTGDPGLCPAFGADPPGPDGAVVSIVAVGCGA